MIRRKGSSGDYLDMFRLVQAVNDYTFCFEIDNSTHNELGKEHVHITTFH